MPGGAPGGHDQAEDCIDYERPGLELLRPPFIPVMGYFSRISAAGATGMRPPRCLFKKVNNCM